MALVSMGALVLLLGTALAMLHRQRNALWNALSGSAGG